MHPTRRSTLVLFVAAVILFVLSASGQAGQYWESGPTWLGYVGWFGFLGCLLLLVVSAVWAVVSRIRRRAQPSPQ